jgi:hypothetical protein
MTTKKEHPTPNFWRRLERMGFGQYAMNEQVRAMRATCNASGGALSARKKKPSHGDQVIGLLTRIAEQLERSDPSACDAPLAPLLTFDESLLIAD